LYPHVRITTILNQTWHFSNTASNKIYKNYNFPHLWYVPHNMKNIMQHLYRISVVFLGKTCYVYNMSQKRWQEFLLQQTPTCAKICTMCYTLCRNLYDSHETALIPFNLYLHRQQCQQCWHQK